MKKLNKLVINKTQELNLTKRAMKEAHKQNLQKNLQEITVLKQKLIESP